MNDDYLYGLNNICVFTSLFFITNIIISYYYKNYIYVFLFSCLLISSIIFHYTQNKTMRVIDQMFVFFVVIYGGYLVFNKSTCNCNNMEYFCIFIVIIVFLACLSLYLSGISNMAIEIFGINGHYYHALIHLFASLGHNLIVTL